MSTIQNLSYRTAQLHDLEKICQLPQSAEELFFMFPKGTYPLTVNQLETIMNTRFDSTVILWDNNVAGFANFYDVQKGAYCSIGNVVVDASCRNKGIGKYLIKIMENIAVEKYNVTELRLSCFNTNTKGILLYSKLGYIPYDIEQRVNPQNELLALIEMKKVIS